MIKNFPLLIALIIVGNIALIITQITQLPDVLFWFLLLLSIGINILGVIGLILHFGVHHIEKLKK